MVVDMGQTNFSFSSQISEKFRFFQATSQKNSIFPGKFGHLQLLLGKFVIVISRFLKRYSKAKRTRAPAYSRALRRIKGGQEKLRSEKLFCFSSRVITFEHTSNA